MSRNSFTDPPPSGRYSNPKPYAPLSTQAPAPPPRAISNISARS